MRIGATAATIGVAFGVVLCWSGMSSPEVIHDALLFADGYLFLFFASAVATAVIGLRVVARLRSRAVLTDEAIDCPVDSPARRHVVGALLFGTGWAVAAACPGPVATQVGQGIGWALFTLAGLLAGVWLFDQRQGELATVSLGEPRRSAT